MFWRSLTFRSTEISHFLAFTSVIITTDSFLLRPLNVLRRSYSFSSSFCLCFTFVRFVSVSVQCLFLIREVGGVASGTERACVSSQISNNFFFFLTHTHTHNTDAETQRDFLFLDSQAFNSPHTLPTLTHTSHKDISHECFTGSAPEEVAFFITIPPFLPLSARPSLCLHLPFMLLFGLVCLIR